MLLGCMADHITMQSPLQCIYLSPFKHFACPRAHSLSSPLSPFCHFRVASGSWHLNGEPDEPTHLPSLVSPKVKWPLNEVRDILKSVFLPIKNNANKSRTLNLVSLSSARCLFNSFPPHPLPQPIIKISDPWNNLTNYLNYSNFTEWLRYLWTSCTYMPWNMRAAEWWTSNEYRSCLE